PRARLGRERGLIGLHVSPCGIELHHHVLIGAHEVIAPGNLWWRRRARSRHDILHHERAGLGGQRLTALEPLHGIGHRGDALRRAHTAEEVAAVVAGLEDIARHEAAHLAVLEEAAAHALAEPAELIAV